MRSCATRSARCGGRWQTSPGSKATRAAANPDRSERRRSGIGAPGALAEAFEQLPAPSMAMARQIGGRRFARRQLRVADQHLERAGLRSEEHTSELQSREN